MTRILLLTKNVMNESSFEQQLRNLGHEVFTSVSLLNQIMHNRLAQDFFSMFQRAVISETIDNRETACLIYKLKEQTLDILRKTDELVDESSELEWKEKGLTGWISCHPTLESLREQLVNEQLDQAEKIYYYPQSKKTIDISQLPLSASESKLLRILYRQQKKYISREALCMEMWGKGKSNSTMSQLSSLVSKLKQKLDLLEVEGEIVETSWGQGYRLHETTYEQLTPYSSTELLVQ